MARSHVTPSQNTVPPHASSDDENVVSTTLPHVVILGGGFGGMAAARALARASVRVTLVDRTNHHIFQPLLYQVATAGLAASDITVPIRWRLRQQKNTDVVLAEVTAIDAVNRTVTLDDEPRLLHYNYLIVATGSRHGYFGHDEWETFAPGLKSIEDANEIKQRFLLAFERADSAVTDEVRKAYLTFVVVGGGPTGVELAGAMSEVARGRLWREFRHSDPRKCRVVLIEGGKRLLPAFPEDLAQKAKHDLEKLGVEVRLGTPVGKVEADGVWVGDEHIPSHNMVWAAGNVASFLGKQVGGETDKAGRVKVAPDLSVPAHPEVFVVGDLCYVERADGRPVPAVAPTANQTGAHAAKTIINRVNDRAADPFRYFHKGDLATIGRSRAIAAFGAVHLHGYLTWFLWLFVHLLYLVGFRNRISVLLQWGYAYFTYGRGVRLISTSWQPGGKPAPVVADKLHTADSHAGPQAVTPPDLNPVTN